MTVEDPEPGKGRRGKPQEELKELRDEMVTNFKEQMKLRWVFYVYLRARNILPWKSRSCGQHICIFGISKFLDICARIIYFAENTEIALAIPNSV